MRAEAMQQTLRAQRIDFHAVLEIVTGFNNRQGQHGDFAVVTDGQMNRFFAGRRAS